MRPPGFERIGHPDGVGAPLGPDEIGGGQICRQRRHVGAQGSDLTQPRRTGATGHGGQRLLVQIDGHYGGVRHLCQRQGGGAAPAAHVEDPARLAGQRGKLLLSEEAIARPPIAHAVQQQLEIPDITFMFIHVFAEPLQVVTLFFTESLLHHPGKVGLRGLMLQLPLPGLELVAGVRTQTGEIRQQIPPALHPAP